MSPFKFKIYSYSDFSNVPSYEKDENKLDQRRDAANTVVKVTLSQSTKSQQPT